MYGSRSSLLLPHSRADALYCMPAFYRGLKSRNSDWAGFNSPGGEYPIHPPTFLTPWDRTLGALVGKARV
jgi:hypothetical protein